MYVLFNEKGKLYFYLQIELLHIVCIYSHDYAHSNMYVCKCS